MVLRLQNSDFYDEMVRAESGCLFREIVTDFKTATFALKITITKDRMIRKVMYYPS
jgi:hypothetical protein